MTVYNPPPASKPASPSGSVQYNNGGVFGGSSNATLTSSGLLTAHALSAVGAFYPSPANPLVSVPLNTSAIYNDGQGNGQLNIFSQNPGNYWNFLQTDASGNWVSRMTMGDPGDGTITFSSFAWSNAVFIIGGYGGGFGNTYMRLTTNTSQGAEFGDALGGQLNINNGTIWVNQDLTAPNGNTFTVVSNNSGNSFNVNAQSDIVSTVHNTLDDGAGNMFVTSALTTTNNTLDDGSGDATINGVFTANNNSTFTQAATFENSITNDGEYIDGSASAGTSGQILSSTGTATKWIVAPAGTVTSVSGSGGTTGLTLTGGPITSSGTLTLGGTLAVANGGTGATSIVGAGIAKIAATGNLTSQSGTIASVVSSTTPNDSNKHTYRVNAYTAITAISAGTITVSFSFTDENGTSRTLNFFPMGLTSAGLTSTGFDSFPPAVIRCNPNTAITVSTSFTGVSTTYDVGGFIEQIT